MIVATSDDQAKRRTAMKSTTRLSRSRTGIQVLDHASIPEDAGFWRDCLGEYLDASGVRRLLGIDSPKRLDELVAAHEILAVPTALGAAFPTFQFVGGEINPTISRVIEIFSTVVATPYSTVSWLRGARFEDKNVAEWIESGEDPEIIIQAAEDSAARLAA
ncbi:MAG: hypothetical protein ACRDJC_15130 [Thermomicrobiales bacterium]